MKVYSLADARYLAEKLHRYSRKCDHTISMNKCYDMVAWFNKHSTWQAFKPYLEELELKRAGMLERMEKRALLSFDAFLADLDFGDKDVHWQRSEDLQKFVESYVEATEVSLQPKKDLNNLKSLCCKLNQFPDLEVKALLQNKSGFYFEYDPYSNLSFFDFHPPVSQDRRIKYALVFPSDLATEEEFLEGFKTKLIKKAYNDELPTQKFLGMLANNK